MAGTKKRSGSNGSRKTRVQETPTTLREDGRTWGLVKRAIRQGWQWSKEWKALIDGADYTCQHCGKRYTNKSKLYVEHIESLALKDLNTAEALWVAMRDMSNIQVWGKECCKKTKDLLDRRLRNAKRKTKS